MRGLLALGESTALNCSYTSHPSRSREIFQISKSVILVALVLLGLGCGEEQAVEQVIARPVKMLTVTTGTTSGVLEYPGKVKAKLTYPMAFEVAGRIIGFAVKEGQRVKKGTVLVRLDPRDYQAQLNAEIAKQNAARAEYERIRSLYEVDAVSRQDLDVARRNFEVARSNVKIARKALQDTYLRATFTGKVAKRLVEDFKNVQAKEPVLILQDETSLEMIVNLPERDWVKAKPGLTLEQRTAAAQPKVALSSIPNRVFPAKIKEFATTADPETRTFQVRLSFNPPSDVNILPGMTGKVIVSPPEFLSSFSIPANAVFADENGVSFVWVVDQSAMTVHSTPVTVGNMSGAYIKIENGLANGDVIAISGVHQLREGMPVRKFETNPT